MVASSVVQTKQTSLKDLCVYFDNSKTDDDQESEVNKFVGLKYIDGKLEIHFPVGYEKTQDASDKQIRKDILNLVSTLSTFGERCDMLNASDILSSSQDVQFPIHAYLFIISDFLNHGYYKQKETIYKKGTSGKINWSRTIKQIRPQIYNENAYYFNFITRNTNYNQDELISQIHKYCVYECFTKIGYLFSSFIPPKPSIKLNKILFTSVIRNAAANTFNENSLLLFKNMIDVINFLDESNEKKNFIYGTNNFHQIWEALVDSVYGECDKDNYYPKVYWKLHDKKTFSFTDSKYNSLRPDTIMITNRGKDDQKIFVLDSKYYRYGATENPYHLPDSSSVVKQIAYAQYIDKQSSEENKPCTIPSEVREKINSDSIYNAFIMPSDCSSPSNIGYASADYVFYSDSTTPDKNYFMIHGILLNVKELMFHHTPKDKEAIATLAKAIEHGSQS